MPLEHSPRHLGLEDQAAELVYNSVSESPYIAAIGPTTDVNSGPGAIPKHYGAGGNHDVQLDAAQDCGSLLNFEKIQTKESAGSVHKLKTPHAKLGAASRKKNELLRLIENKSATLLEVEVKYAGYMRALEGLYREVDDRIKNSHPEEAEHLIKWLTPHKDEALRMQQLVNLYVKQKRETEKKSSIFLKTSSVKSVKSGTLKSCSSSSSSARARLAEKRAKLEADRKYEIELEKIEEEEIEIRKTTEKRELEMKRKKRRAELARAEYEHQLLERELDGIDDGKSLNNSQQLSDDDEFGVPGEEKPFANKLENSAITAEHPDVRLITEVLRKQVEISNKMVSCQERVNLPKKVVTIFNGRNLAEYPTFIRNFTKHISSRCDAADSFYYLEQYTSDSARDLVRSCSNHNPEVAFQTALELLDEEFGNEYKIAATYVEKLNNWPPLKSEDGAALRELSMFTLTCRNYMNQMSSFNQLNSPSQIMSLVHKLPYDLRKQWRSFTLDLSENRKEANFNQLVDFLRRQARLYNQPVFGQINAEVRKPEKMVLRPQRVLTTRVILPEPENEFIRACLYCKKSNHGLENCFTFRRLPYPERIEFVKSCRLCFSCLDEGHMSRSCVQKLECKECHKRHPTALHNDQRREYLPVEEPEKEAVNSSVSDVKILRTSLPVYGADAETGAGKKTMCPMVPLKLRVRGMDRFVTTYAALDTCSTACLLNPTLLTELGVPANKQRINMNTAERETCADTNVINNLQLFDLEGRQHDEVPVTFAQQHWAFKPEDVPGKHQLDYPHLRNVPYNFVDADVGMIIGMDRSEMLKPLKLVSGPAGTPYATLHKLGWAVCGPVRDKRGENKINTCVTICKNILEKEIQEFYNSDYKDSHDTSLEYSENDKRWLEIMESSVKLTKDNHYEISLPFKNSEFPMVSNKEQAYKHFLSMRSRMKRNEKYFSDYKNFMETMIRDGHMESVPLSDNSANSQSWYLTHHGVYHKQKEKIRIVFNCSLPYRGLSLNDMLLQGPDLTNNLLGVLLRFRQEPIAFTSDIKKMFYQVRVPQQDRRFLRFLWFGDSDLNGDIVEYRLAVHVFGATSSPSVANFALQQTVKESIGVTEKVRDTVLRNFYVDDLLKSCKTEADAVAVFRDVRTAVAAGGFTLAKFVCNSASVVEALGEQSGLGEECVNISGNGSDRVLGLKWNITSDLLSFNINLSNKPITRRGILSTMNSVYDPMGLCCPAILPAKQIFQETCHLKLDWNQELPGHLKERWIKWVADLAMLETYSFPRCLKSGEASSTEVHYFSDGSEVGYGAVAFVRFKSPQGLIHCAPIIAKGRLNPVNNNIIKTIPRIELNGAKISIVLQQIIHKEMDLVIDREYFWTDSSTVLKYLYNDNTQFMRFVANRVAFIKSHSHKESWRHVPGQQNPADIISRGLPINRFISSELWKSGPMFLWQDEEGWPVQNVTDEISEDMETKKPKLHQVSCMRAEIVTINYSPTRMLLESCSVWSKLKRRVAWMLRFRTVLRTSEQCEGNLELKEIIESELCIVEFIQSDFLPDLKQVLASKQLPKDKSLRRLNLFLDERNMIRVGGRLENSDLTYGRIHPLLLPSRNPVVGLMVADLHRTCGHMGREYILNKVQEKYWIIGVNSLIKNVMFNCILCRRQNANPYLPQMAPLPNDRLTADVPAFTNIGLDYFGPFAVLNGRKNEKRYGVIFSCLSSRALHLEMSCSLNTDSFINAFRRFLARRGNVKVVRSDNGTNLVAGEKELRESIVSWNQSKIEKWMIQRSIEWKFQPPASSHFGGAFEREIRNVRKVFNSLLAEQPLKLNDEQLNTLLCEAECILNGRPLTEISRDCNDFEALTPNHLLLLSAGTTSPPGLFVKEDNNLRRRWRQVQYLANIFWSRWRKLYVPLLQERQKWQAHSYQYSVGDLVLLTDQNLPRSQWSLGRIMEVCPSDDGIVRVVKLRVAKVNTTTQGGYTAVELKRPVAKLVLMKTLQ